MMVEYDILLGREADGAYLRFGGSEHVALHARTGAGKTSGFTIPNCFTWRGSLVVLDIKGEAFQATAGHRKAMGQEVYLLDPAAENRRSHRWDPFNAIQRNSIERFDQISRQAFLLFPEVQAGQGGSNSDKFWDPAGRGAFTAVATLIAETPNEPLTMASVLRVFARGDGHEWLARKISARRAAGDPYSTMVVDGISDYLNGETPQVEGIRKTVSTRMQAWYNPIIAAATSASDFDLRDIRRKPMTIYVAVSPGNMARMRPFLRLFFDQLVNLNTDRTPQQDPTLKVHTLVLLDEFVRLGRIDTLAEGAQFVRGYGMRMAFVIQNKAQLRELYGKDGEADIFDNLGAEIVFGTADRELTEELENRLGDSTVMFTTHNRPRFWAWMNLAKQGESDHPHRRPLMLDQEVARMSPLEQLIVRPGMRPMKTRRVCWYTDPRFTTRVRPPPEIPKLKVEIDYDDGSTRVLRKRPRAMSGLTQADVEDGPPANHPDDPGY